MKRQFKDIGLGIALIILLFVAQCVINLIPIKCIESNIVKSINEYKGSGLRDEVIVGYPQTTDDILADFALLQVIYNIDSKNVIQSTLEANCYTRYGDRRLELEEQINNNFNINESYSRYWHGMTIILRPLLTCISLKEIKFLLCVVIGILMVINSIILYKKKQTLFMVALWISYLASLSFFSFLSIEYMPVYIITYIAMLRILNTGQRIESIMFQTGILVAYFDFLTTETLTLVIPMLLIYTITKSNKLKTLVNGSFAWIVGYAITFLLRFTVNWICGIENSANGSFLAEKITSIKAKTGYFNSTSAVLKNLRELFFVKNMQSRATILIIVISAIVLCMFLYAFKQKQFRIKDIAPQFIISTIPIVRFIVINAHSYNHYMFTYRALWGTLLGISLISIRSVYKIKNKKGE